MGRGKRQRKRVTAPAQSELAEAIAAAIHRPASLAATVYAAMTPVDQQALLKRLTAHHPRLGEKSLPDNYLRLQNIFVLIADDRKLAQQIEREALEVQAQLGYGAYLEAAGTAIPEVADFAELVKELDLRFPEIGWRLLEVDLPLESSEPFFRQLHRLFLRYPLLRSSCWSVGIEELPVEDECLARVRHGGHLKLNKTAFTQPQALQQRLVDNERNGFHPPGSATAGFIASHEFGHTIASLLREMAWHQASRRGLEGEAAVEEGERTWREWLDSRRCHISDYGQESDEELWAEAFAALQHSPPASWPPLVVDLDKLLQPLTSTG